MTYQITQHSTTQLEGTSMRPNPIKVTIIAGPPGSFKTIQMKKLLNGAPMNELAFTSLNEGRKLTLDDFDLGQNGTVGIDEARALSDEALDELIQVCAFQKRDLVLGTQLPKNTDEIARICNASLGRLRAESASSCVRG